MTPRKLQMPRRLHRLAKNVYRARLGNIAPQSVIVVLGCQRSGTTALLAAFEQDWNARVFNEYSSLNADPQSRKSSPGVETNSTLRWRPYKEVNQLIRQTR